MTAPVAVHPVRAPVRRAVRAETALHRGLCGLCGQNRRARIGGRAPLRPCAHPRPRTGMCPHTPHTPHSRITARVRGGRTPHRTPHATAHSRDASRAVVLTLADRKKMEGGLSMRSHGRQLDLVRHGDAAKALAYREAAATALRNPYESPEACARRAAHYLAEAKRHERTERRA